MSQLYGFEYLPKLKTVTIDSIDNHNSPSDDEEEQREVNDAATAVSYYRRYNQRPKKPNVNQSLESSESEQMEEQQVKVELLFLKETIEEKLQPLKHDFAVFKGSWRVFYMMWHVSWTISKFDSNYFTQTLS